MARAVVAEYVWIASLKNVTEPNLRSKARVLNTEKENITLDDLPVWNFDGSSTGQAASTDKSEVLLIPVFLCADPFRGAPHVLVLCDTRSSQEEGEPSTRTKALESFEPDAVERDQPWFGLEQEYVIMDSSAAPLHWLKRSPRANTKAHYCGVGVRAAWGREVAEEHLDACLKAGLRISGINGEVMPSQWEFQIGPCVGIDAGDQLWMARYLLLRVAERAGVDISFHPKCIQNYSGSGCHANFSTASMRESNNLLPRLLQELRADHERLMLSTHDYGVANAQRLTGMHETAPLAFFSAGVGDRSASVRIPVETERAGKGYIEDRRPAANADPYFVSAYLYDAARRAAAEP